MKKINLDEILKKTRLELTQKEKSLFLKFFLKVKGDLRKIEKIGKVGKVESRDFLFFSDLEKIFNNSKIAKITNNCLKKNTKINKKNFIVFEKINRK